MHEIVKRCACGTSYERAAWVRLRLVGYQDLEEQGTYELRDCATCRSTISVLVDEADVARHRLSR